VILVYTFTMDVNTEMAKIAKKSAGRPPGRTQDRPFQMRVNDDFLREIDDWRRKEPDLPHRAEAIRRLVKKGLGRK
jgi:hypothetical protein